MEHSFHGPDEIDLRLREADSPVMQFICYLATTFDSLNTY